MSAIAIQRDSELLQNIAIGRLLPTRANPRKELRELDDLVASIKRSGVLVPLTVEVFGANYRVVAGHRRLAAARVVGLASLPCMVRRYTDDDDRLIAMLVDNVQRNDLTPLEQAEVFQHFVKQGLTQAAIATRVGKSAGWISKCLQLLELGVKDQRLVASGQLSMNEALGYLASAKDPQYCRRCGQRLR